MNLKPLGDRVLVRQDEPETTTASGLVLPENTVEAPVTGRVIAIGPEVNEVTVGDRVLLRRYAGDTLPDSSLVLHEEEILLVILVG